MAFPRLPTDESTWCLIGSGGQSATPGRVRVHTTPFTVGRRPEMHLTLSCTSVSSRHAELVTDGESLVVRDLKSTNGTYVNGNPVRAATKVKEGDYLQFAKVVFRVGREACISNSRTSLGASCDEALAMIQFDKLVSERGVVPYFQPIVYVADHARVGFEVLARSRLFGLQSPDAMFSAASLLESEGVLSRLCRSEALVTAAKVPDPRMLFLNTHPRELDDPAALVVSLRELRQAFPQQPITLEIHEGAVTDGRTMLELRAVLEELDMRLAYDDFGAGQARFVELVEVPPDFLKFDMKLVQGIHSASVARQQLVGSLVHMANDLGIATLAEGVECQEDGDACRELGFALGQGFYYGRPAPARDFAENPRSGQGASPCAAALQGAE